MEHKSTYMQEITKCVCVRGGGGVVCTPNEWGKYAYSQAERYHHDASGMKQSCHV